MATKDAIKKVILEVAGNPDSGIVAEYADKWAEAIAKLDAPEEKAAPSVGLTKENRVTKPTEIR